MSRSGTRLALRKMRRKYPEQKGEISQILWDGDMLELLEDELALEVAKSGVQSTLVGVAWFTWLLANYEIVLKVVSVIILLFADVKDDEVSEPA